MQVHRVLLVVCVVRLVVLVVVVVEVPSRSGLNMKPPHVRRGRWRGKQRRSVLALSTLFAYLHDHPSGDKEVVLGTGHPTGHQRATAAHGRRDGSRDGGRRKICLDFALATEGSFISPAHAASPRPLAHTNDTKRFPGWGHSALTPTNLRHRNWGPSDKQ